MKDEVIHAAKSICHDLHEGHVPGCGKCLSLTDMEEACKFIGKSIQHSLETSCLRGLTLEDDMKETVQISQFVRRQTKNSEFSHFDGADATLLELVSNNWDQHNPGYRNGVVLVPVLQEWAIKKFYCGVCKLKEGDKLSGAYKARQPGEKPRKSTYKVGGEKMQACGVDLVCYHKDVLQENNERSSEADWEIVSINARPSMEEMPIATGALIANHLQLSGGTRTNMSDEDFVKQLRISQAYWSDKALVEPKEG